MKTTIEHGDGHHGHTITRSDGHTLTVWFLGRCWTYNEYENGGLLVGGHDFSGRDCDAEKIVRSIRHRFAMDIFPRA